MTESSPKVSVVMAVYDEAEHISNAIESILEQTFGDFEFLIIDDGSTDKTPEIIKSYAKQDNRIRYLTNQRNEGLPASLNKGIERASGKYIARMDADDISLSNRFEEQVKHLDSRSDLHVVGSYTYLIEMNGEVIGERSYPQAGRSPEQLKEQGPGVAHPSVMIRRSSLQRVGNYRKPFTYAQDLDLWVRMSREFGEDFLGIIPKPLLKYRLTPGQYNRNTVIKIYESYVGEHIGHEKELGNKITKKVEQHEQEDSPTKAKMMYHYRVGRLLLDQDKRLKALRHFKSALLGTPYSPRGWYGIGLVCLPKSLREYVISNISE